MLRYRMNDLLDLDPAPCPCGSAFTAVRAVAGRMDDVFLLARPPGATDMPPVAVTPDVIRNAVIDANPCIDDFRVIQVAPDRVDLRLPRQSVAALPDAQRTLSELFVRHGARVVVDARAEALPALDARKLRRVVRSCP